MKRFLLAAFIAATALPAEAFVCTRTNGMFGPSLTWTGRMVSWVMSAQMTTDIPNAEDSKAALIASFDAWTQVPCSDLEFVLSEVRAGAKAEALDGGPYENVVVFLPTGWPYEPNIIALTTNAFDPKTGRMLDSDIEINDQHFEFVIAEQGCEPVAGRTDLQNTITHEVGHVLGLDHPPKEAQFAEETMFPSAPPCETTKRTLEMGDTGGICSIYPLGLPNAPCFPPEGPTFDVIAMDDGMGCSTTGAESLLPILMVLVLGRRLFRIR